MLVGLHDSERNGYPSLPLMKLSAHHKRLGDDVQWFNSLREFDAVYSSKVFTWTPEDPYLPEWSVRGGTGYEYKTILTLEDAVEHICPDYALYGLSQSYGFLTRGCPNKCKWCFVPEKEGDIRPHADIEEFARHKEVILMDNNVLAHPHGIEQIQKISKLGLKVDFNQGLDARRIDASVAKLLSKVKWLSPVRLACDSSSQIESVRKAVELLRWHNVSPARYFCYVLVDDVDDALERIKFLKGMYVDAFAQPYRSKEGGQPTQKQIDLARWCNHKAINKTVPFEQYKR